MIQTKYQREVFERYGHTFAGLDATHNTTHYENTSLFTVVVHDQWGHGEPKSWFPFHGMQELIAIFNQGCPVAWMISFNATEITIDYFINTLQLQNPKVIPVKFMSDFNKAQINVIKHCYPESQLFLCWWHVLHAWQQHLVITHFQELWKLLKGWIHITEKSEFEDCWEKIQQLTPASFIEYILEHWMPVWYMWSTTEHKDHTIFEISETNMLVEAYVFPSLSMINHQLIKFYS